MIPFAELLPDLPDLNNPGATVAENVLPAKVGYKPLSGLNVQSGTLTNYARGAKSVKNKSGSNFNYAGDGTKLYTVTATGATDVSRTTPAYALGAEDYWEFAKFGDKIIAVAFTEDPQVITLGNPNFAALGGTPPKARHIATIGRQDAFVVLGNVNDTTDGLVPNRVQWSAAGDETGWTSGTNLAGQQDLQGNGGWIQRVIGGEFGLIFQERAIWRMDWAGAPGVFSFAEIEDGRGTPAPGSVVKVGNVFFYLGDDGFYAHNGVQSVPIGADKINKTFYSQVDQNQILRISAAADPINNYVIWAYPTGNSAGNGDPDSLIIYDFVNDKWSTGEVDCELVFSALSDDIGLDTAPLATLNLDTMTASLDSRQWIGGALLLSAFDRTHSLSYFNGSTLEATMETGEFRGNPQGTSLVTSARPLVDGTSNVTVSVGSRQLQSEAVSFGSPVSLNDLGEADLRIDARYHRFRVSVASGETWKDAMGVEPVSVSTGRR